MNLKLPVIVTFLSLLLVGCGMSASATGTPTVVATPTLPPPGAHTTQAPSVENTAQAYLDAWMAEDYKTMYGMLTKVSQDAISEEEFTNLYRGIAAEVALSELQTKVLSSLTQTRNSQVSYQVLMRSALVGDIQRDTTMNLSLEDNQWRVQWDRSLILPELSGGNTLRMDYLIPSRGNIYDRNESALVAQADATAIGLFPDQIDPDQEDTLYSEIWRLTDIHPDNLSAMIEEVPEGLGWYLPIAEVSADQIQEREGVLSGLAGLVMRPFRSRYYFDGGIAPHAVGYVGFIPEEQLEEYKRLGYRQDERVGQAGLEKWGEAQLSGKRAGALYVVDPNGQVVTKLAETAPAPSQAIYTTLDKDLQLAAQLALNGFLGAAVVLERDTGRVLAMASSPGFDPNLFEPENLNSSYKIQELYDQDTLPLINRATQGQYPLGSVFKLVTMAAALESGLYAPDTPYTCQHTFTELPGVTLYDWTYEKELPASGELTLVEGLMRSCNPYFYHIGNDLFSQGLTTAVSDMARKFGLGQATGIDQVAEEEGQVPDPQSQLDATNLAIGQGAFLATPLQVAEFVAALGNGGTLYRPQIIERIAPPDGDPTYTFKPEPRGELPISQATFEAIREGMVAVVDNSRGTAHRVFANFPIPIAGKTGTAQVPPLTPHAWFAGYTYAERENKPDIAVVVLLENAGEGSEVAAPVFKAIVQEYFYGRRDTLPWETLPGVWKTPTPEETETPQP